MYSSMLSERAKSLLAGKHVLIVEDELMVAVRTEQMLEDLGCTVQGPVPNVHAALRLLEQAEPDIAVLDVNLGDHRVFPVADELRRRGIPFIFATGYNSSTIPEPYRKCSRLEKPFNVEQLAHELAEACDGAIG